MIQKLKEVKEMCPEILAQLQAGELSLCDAGELTVFFANMAETLRNGIKSRMCDQRIALQEDDRVRIKLGEKYNYDYAEDPNWQALNLDCEVAKQRKKEYESSHQDNEYCKQSLSPMLTINQK